MVSLETEAVCRPPLRRAGAFRRPIYFASKFNLSTDVFFASLCTRNSIITSVPRKPFTRRTRKPSVVSAMSMPASAKMIATLFIVVAFLLITVCGFCIALNARDNFGCLLASGVTFLISLQAVINIGVVTSVLPNKGLALPFISSGGSSLLAMLVGVGILLSVAYRAPARVNPARENISEPAIGAGDNPFAARAT